MKLRNIFTLLLLSTALGATAQINSGLLYNFKFNGSLTDSLNSNVTFVKNGTSSAFVTDRKNNANSALSVANRTNAILSNIPQNNNTRSIAVWFYFNSINTTEQQIISYGNYATNQAFGFSVQPGAGTAKYYGWNNDITVNYTFTPNNWYHLVLNYDGYTASAYINGVQIINTTWTGWNTSGQTLYLAESPGGSASYNISFDDLRIYNRILTSTEVATLAELSIDVPALKQSVLSYYSFDSNFSNQNNSLPLTQYNVVPTITGKKGNAANFNGTNALYSTDYNSLFNESTSKKPFTISFWKQDKSFNSYSTLFELYGSYYARHRNSGLFEVGYQGANSSTWYYTSTTVSTANFNTWAHYTIVHDPAGGRDYVYVNGINNLSFTNSNTAVNQTFNKFTIGSGTDASGNIYSIKNYGGYIDEFYIFNKALSPSEISYLYNNIDFGATTTTTDIDVHETTPDIKIYPNPATEIINFIAYGDVKKEIWNIQGVKVAETFENSLRIKDLSNGIYFVRFISNNQTVGLTKFVKN